MTVDRENSAAGVGRGRGRGVGLKYLVIYTLKILNARVANTKYAKYLT